VVEDSREQLRTTRERLKHFAVQHPLVSRVRASLVRSIADQIHLSETFTSGADELTRLLDAASSSETRVQLEPNADAVAHVWSFATETKNEILQETGKARVEIHGKDETMKWFQKIVGNPI
jgi:vacuolar-type H+-ATPase subunit D/Vma8